MTDDAELQAQAANNPKHKFRLAMDSKLEAALFAHLDEHTGLVKTFIETPEIQALLVPAMLDFVYRRAGDKYRTAADA